MDDVSALEHLKALMDKEERSHAREHELIDHALGMARQVVDSRLEHLNELRTEVLTDRSLYVKRDLFDARVGPLEEFKSRALGFGALVALVSAVVGSMLTAVVLG